MQDYQFVTDAYRLTAAIHRLCTAANTWYNCAPTQKYLLRQLKAMDYPLVGESQKKSFPAGRAGYTTKDESGLPLIASDMDTALLMLYGHILYCGRSFTPALSGSSLCCQCLGRGAVANQMRTQTTSIVHTRWTLETR